MCWTDWEDYDFRVESPRLFPVDLDIEDFAIIGGIIGYFEEQGEEERIQDRIHEGIDPDDDGAP